MSSHYPEFIENLPDAEIAIPGIRGKLLQAGNYQIVFFDIEPIGQIPPHRHSAQYGIVLEGEMVLTIDGVAQTLKKGDSYFIPAGAEHSATFKTHFKAMDLFDEPGRYQPKKRQV